MAFSLGQIKLIKSIDLDNFAIRGAKAGVNNARSTGPLYDSGSYNSLKTILTGTATVTSKTSNDSTVTGITGLPYSLTALDLVTGDKIVARSDTTLTVSSLINSTTVIIDPLVLPQFSGTVTDATFLLTDRDYLIEPDVGSNTISTSNGNGESKFTKDSTTVTGLGTQWLSDMTSGDMIQLNTYQKYFIVSQVLNDTTCTLTAPFDINSSGYQAYTSKKWRLNREEYRYVKQNFIYDNQHAKWVCDSTTGSDLVADSNTSPFKDGINLKFTPTLSPASYPDIMDSNVVLNKTLTRSTDNDMYQYPLPAVPVPEGSLQLYINDTLKDRFPAGNKDYVVNYSQMPFYVYPPPIDQRTVANIMFLKGIQNVSLNPANTSSGVINFTDSSGNSLQGVMPGSETLLVDGIDQTANVDYVMNTDAGIAIASKGIYNESVVKYINYKVPGLFDTGLNITKGGTTQVLTLPGKSTDDVLFDYESGRLKPINKDNPGPGENYIVQYFTAGTYVSNETLQLTGPTDWVRTSQYPIKYQSLMLSKNGEYLDEGVDYIISCLTGRVVFSQTLNTGDTLVLNYSPLVKHKNGLTYEEGQTYCTVYDSTVAVTSVSPTITLQFSDTNISNDTVAIQSAYNATKAKYYNVAGSTLTGTTLQFVSDSANLAVGTELTDSVILVYKFPSEGLEYAPVETINFVMTEGSDYIHFVGQDVTSIFVPNKVVRLTNVDSAGDYYFNIASSVYDGEDTFVFFYGKTPVDLINPDIYVSDTYVISFNPPPVTPLPVVSGSTDVDFTGMDLTKTFRPGQLFNLGTDYYNVQGSSYDSVSKVTSVSLGVQTFTDYTSSGVLAASRVSDVPFYVEGDTIVSTSKDIITDPTAPTMVLTYPGYATVTKDATALDVAIGTSHYTFTDSSYSVISDLKTQLTGLGFNVNAIVPQWQTKKLIQASNLVVTSDSSSVLSSIPALRLNSVDSTDFSISGGNLTLNSPLVRGQRYDLDYLGQRQLNDSTVTFSGSYFTLLPAKSKVSISMQYTNLDQFYIQVMSERSFLDDVVIPQRQAEANQQNGNVGQGGDLPNDEPVGNSAGGVAGDEYRRVDQVIECDIFQKIFDFFNDRLQAYGNEFYASMGYKLCNNDGPFSDTNQNSGTIAVNRLFPWGDYTSTQPYPIVCITGQAIPYAVPGPKKPIEVPVGSAKFTNGSTIVSSTTYYPSYWTHQLQTGDWIRPFDATKNYAVASITDDLHLKLAAPYDGPTATKVYVMTSEFPLYDDDGFMGAKFIGTISESFNLQSGDVFDAIIDGSYQSYSFQDPPGALALLFPVNGYSPQQIASIITSNFTGLRMSYEWAFDPTSSFGYRDALVIRSTGTNNSITLGIGSAVAKLGFTSNTSSYGNFNTVYSDPEYTHLVQEANAVSNEKSALVTLITLPNKMDRTSVVYQNLITSTIITDCNTELSNIGTELQRLSDETKALCTLLTEQSLSGGTNLTALGDATSFINDCIASKIYAQSIVSDYQGAHSPYTWALGIKGPETTTIPINPGGTSFVLSIPAGDNDIRVLDAIVNSISYRIVTVYHDNGQIVDGTWSGYDPLSGDQYSQQNSFFFHQDDRTDSLILNETDSSHTHAYFVDSTGLNIIWDGVNSTHFPYSTMTTFANLKAAINIAGIPSLDATGNVEVDSFSPGFLPIGSSGSPIPITNSEAILPGLRDCDVIYYTIDDKFLNDRYSYISARSNTLNNRKNFLISRSLQIRSDMVNDNYFMTGNNDSGNLYIWANNMFNRSNGSFARLNQLEKQLELNKFSLQTNRLFI